MEQRNYMKIVAHVRELFGVRAALMQKLMLLALFCLGGCTIANTRQSRVTIGDEVIAAFGSIESALQQPWIIWSVFGKARPRELTEDQKATLMDAIKDCYVWEQDGAREETEGGSVCASPDLYVLDVGPGLVPKFSLYLLESGFLAYHMCASPGDVVNVNYTIRAIFQGQRFYCREKNRDGIWSSTP